MPEFGHAKLEAHRETGGPYYHLTLSYPFAGRVEPGQFVMLSVKGQAEPFLKRPYSVYRAVAPTDMEPGRLELLIKDVGRGSHLLRETPTGSELEVIGPLGRPFSCREGLRQAWFVAGGIGVAPFVHLAAELKVRGVVMTAFVGGRTATDLQALDDLRAFGVRIVTATEDGSCGVRGRVTEPLREALAARTEPVELFVCGPEAMMRAVGRIALEADVPCQLSLESLMGCGIGVCLGCVVKDAEGNFIRVCREGAVREVRELRDYGLLDAKGGAK